MPQQSPNMEWKANRKRNVFPLSLSLFPSQKRRNCKNAKKKRKSNERNGWMEGRKYNVSKQNENSWQRIGMTVCRKWKTTSRSRTRNTMKWSELKWRQTFYLPNSFFVGCLIVVLCVCVRWLFGKLLQFSWLSTILLIGGNFFFRNCCSMRSQRFIVR